MIKVELEYNRFKKKFKIRIFRTEDDILEYIEKYNCKVNHYSNKIVNFKML